MRCARAKQLARPTPWTASSSKVRARYDQDYLLLQGDWLYLEPYFEIEQETAAGIARMLQNPGTPVGDWDTIRSNLDQYADFALSPDQVEAVRLALAHRLVVITGGPGCGQDDDRSRHLQHHAGAGPEPDVVRAHRQGRAAHDRGHRPAGRHHPPHPGHLRR
ncbi:MAG: hypothetical protein V9H69_18220 [Anaerolineae bacterium]